MKKLGVRVHMPTGIAMVALLLTACGQETSTVEAGQGLQNASDSEEKPFLEYSAAVDNIEPVGNPIPVTPKLLKHGEWVFRGMCIGCHGAGGDGNGAVWELADQYSPNHKLPRRPRDFTQAVFKIRSTPSGSFPTDVDLFKSISRGLVADQDMPAFKYLPERDRWAVVAYIKTFTDLWEEEAEYQEDPIEVGEPPVPDAQMLVAGKDVYAQMKCAKCHGELGLGDGPSADELEDDSGLPIIPRNFTDASQFVGGSDPASIFQTFNTGFDGTPMPSFLDFLDAAQSWQLVWYVISLRPEFNLTATRKMMMEERGIPMAASMVSTLAPPPAPVQAAPASTSQSEAVAAPALEPKDAAEPATVAALDSGQEDTKPQAASKQPTKIGDYQEVEVTDGGVLHGKILYNGAIKRRTVLPTKDKKVCGKSRKVPLIQVGEDGSVRDAVVYLKDISAGKAWPELALKTPVLDQKGCEFLPHVQVGRLGSIDIVNSDPVLHNTHGYYGKRTAFNVALPQKDQRVSKVLKRPGTVKVDCDAHGWMLGWVQVVENPYFAQTGEDGEFSIDGVPPGDYTLVVWQEWLGETETQIRVAAGGTTELNIELRK